MKDPRIKPMTNIQKISMLVQIFLLFLISTVAVYSFIIQEYINVLMCIFIVVLMAFPVFLSKWFKFVLTAEINLIVVLFVFAAMFLGEIFDFYEMIWWWDIFLHSLSGVLIGYFGYSLVYLMNQSTNVELSLSPLFISVFAFAFSMMIAVTWEIIEFSVDSIFGLNMQKSGLVDTMWDFIVCFIGSLVPPVLGFIEAKRKKKNFLQRIFNKFIAANLRKYRKKRTELDN